MQLSVDASAFNAALSRYVQVSRKDHVKILTSKAGDVCLRSAQAAKGGKTADRSKIANIWQTTDWKSKTPWSGKDWWGLFISKLLAVQGFKLNLGRRRVKNQAESDFVSQRSKAAGSAGYYARGTGRWMKKVDGKWKSFKGNRATMTQFRQVTRANMKSRSKSSGITDYGRVSKAVLRRRSSRVGAFVAAFAMAGAAFGKNISRVRGKPWAARALLPTTTAMRAYFEVPILGSKYPMRPKTAPQEVDAQRKEIILNGYLRQGLDYVVRDIGAYIARKLAERAKQSGLRAA